MSNLKDKQKKNAVCGTCNIMLVKKAYERAWWFRLVREPLRLGMIFIAKLYRVDPSEYEFRSEECKGCPRFLKLALKDRSPLFIRLNDMLNPLFDSLKAGLVTQDELNEAKEFAARMTSESNPEKEKNSEKQIRAK